MMNLNNGNAGELDYDLSVSHDVRKESVTIKKGEKSHSVASERNHLRKKGVPCVPKLALPVENEAQSVPEIVDESSRREPGSSKADNAKKAKSRKLMFPYMILNAMSLIKSSKYSKSSNGQISNVTSSTHIEDDDVFKRPSLTESEGAKNNGLIGQTNSMFQFSDENLNFERRKSSSPMLILYPASPSAKRHRREPCAEFHESPSHSNYSENSQGFRSCSSSIDCGSSYESPMVTSRECMQKRKSSSPLIFITPSASSRDVYEDGFYDESLDNAHLSPYYKKRDAYINTASSCQIKPDSPPIINGDYNSKISLDSIKKEVETPYQSAFCLPFLLKASGETDVSNPTPSRRSSRSNSFHSAITIFHFESETEQDSCSNRSFTSKASEKSANLYNFKEYLAEAARMHKKWYKEKMYVLVFQIFTLFLCSLIFA